MADEEATHRARLIERHKARFGDRMTFRVSLDHYTRAAHEAERGADSWGKGMAGLIAMIREGRFAKTDNVVFLHTGGAAGLFAYGAAFALKVPHRIAAPCALIGTSNFFELAVAVIGRT